MCRDTWTAGPSTHFGSLPLTRGLWASGCALPHRGVCNWFCVDCFSPPTIPGCPCSILAFLLSPLICLCLLHLASCNLCPSPHLHLHHLSSTTSPSRQNVSSVHFNASHSLLPLLSTGPFARLLALAQIVSAQGPILNLETYLHSWPGSIRTSQTALIFGHTHSCLDLSTF